MSPLAPSSAATDQVITITPEALAELVQLRDAEPEAGRLGLRLEIVSDPGEEFRYDLSFEIVTKAALTDIVRNHDGLKVIIPAVDTDRLDGATLDHTATQGLVIRNPNKPAAPVVAGLTLDDDLSTQIRDLIDVEVNPSLASHGGFVTYVGHDDEGTAYLTMGGGCHGCSMSKVTMLEGVQTMIVAKLPDVERVRDITDHETGENPYYR